MLQLERFTAVKWVRPGTHRTLDPPFAIRFDCKGTCTVLGVLRMTFHCQSGKPLPLHRKFQTRHSLDREFPLRSTWFFKSFHPSSKSSITRNFGEWESSGTNAYQNHCLHSGTDGWSPSPLSQKSRFRDALEILLMPLPPASSCTTSLMLLTMVMLLSAT